MSNVDLSDTAVSLFNESYNEFYRIEATKAFEAMGGKERMAVPPECELKPELLPPEYVPIPNANITSNAVTYKDIDPVSELVNEGIVDALQEGVNGASYYRHLASRNDLYGKNFDVAFEGVFVRKRIVECLKDVNNWLLEHTDNWCLFVLDGLRNLDTQREIRKCFIETETKYKDQEKANELAKIYYSEPPEKVLLEDPKTWYAHSTGCALDVTLVGRSDHDKSQAWTASQFDGMGADLLTRYFEVKQQLKHLPDLAPNGGLEPAERSAIKNRRVLFWAMTLGSGGRFVNYPHEFFHFEYIDRDMRTQFGIQNAKALGLKWPDGADMRPNVGPMVGEVN